MQPDHEDDNPSEAATPKASNFIHRGFNDLLAMLPTGSGTGASAFFRSMHEGSIDGTRDGGSNNLPSPPLETHEALGYGSSSNTWLWSHKMGEAGRGVLRTRDATEMSLEKASIHQSAVQPLMIPSRVDGEIITTNEGTTTAQKALRELPATPTTARTAAVKTPVTEPSLARPLPAVPNVIPPTRSTIALPRSPLSPPPTSTMAFQEFQRPMMPYTNLPHVQSRQPIWEKSDFSPLVADGRIQPLKTAGPTRERRSLIPEGILGSPDSRGKRTVGLQAVSPGKIDKRLISWPMDFR